MEKQESNLVKRSPNKQETEELDDPLWVCIQGIRKFMPDYHIVKELKKSLKNYEEINFDKIHKDKKKNYFFVRLKDEESLKKLNEAFPIKIKNRKLKIKGGKLSRIALQRARTFEQVQDYIKKRTKMHRTYVPPDKEFLESLDRPKIIEMMKSKICGYANLDYEKQIELKKDRLRNYLRDIKKMAVKATERMWHELDWIKREAEETEQPDDDNASDLCCPLESFLECPVESRQFYRNKNEFTVGKCALTGRIKIGFNVSEGRKHFYTIELGEKFEDPLTCPKQAFQLMVIAEELVNQSGIPEWSKYKVESGKNGFWRNFIVRVSQETKEILVNVVVRKNYFKERAEDPEETNKESLTFEKKIKEEFVPSFLKQMGESEVLKGYKLMGLTFQDSSATSDAVPYVEDTELEVLAGKGTVYHERILGNVFEVSNSSFLQVNTTAMNNMYEYSGKLVNIDKDTILLDICSGIGTIGLSVGQNAKKIIGIEMVASSCENARRNAKNCNQEAGVEYEVICSKVEDVINEIAENHQGSRLVGIIDPPRAGLHPKVTKTLRRCRGLNELVFMACDLNQSKKNILELCLPSDGKKRKGPAFMPVYATGVDMFPNTPHFESIFYLKRDPPVAVRETPVEKIVAVE